MTAPPILYEPSAQRIERATLTRFMGFVEQRRGLGFDDYDALWRWSVDDLDGFWSSIWEFFDVRASGDPAPVLGRRAMPGAEWFPNTRLNYAEHIFRDRNRDEVAVVHASELRELAEITWGELGDRVARVAAGLRSLGVARGDRVVAYMPNIPEALVAFLAVASIGAIWSSAAPEFGARSVVDRFEQIEPKLLLAVDGYRYGGRDFDRVALVGRLREALGTLEHTVLLPYLSDDPELDGAITWDDLLALGYGARLEFERVAFGDPLWVLYSSGTTGLPKAIVHSQGGILIEQLKKGHLHLDLQRGERMFWFTTTGWMMWNFLVGCLLTDAAIVLYDGSAGHPDVGGLWRLAERAGITCFGTSAGYIGACMKAGVEPGRQYDLARLAAVGSTGSPLPPEGFRWVYDHVGRDLWLYSTSGGTDLCTAFVSGCPLLPVYEGEIQCRALGAAVEAWDEHGRPLVDEVGELVLTEPMPSMPIGFWGDDGERLAESYFAMFPGVWRHGDWIKLTDRGTAVIYGRSDATINRQGVRMGTSEIYRAVLSEDDVTDALVVDVPSEDGTGSWMPLFVVLRDGVELDDELKARIARRIRDYCSPRHVPDETYRVDELPRTLSGKLLEVPVKKILTGSSPESAASRDSLANPKALDYFVELAGERSGARR